MPRGVADLRNIWQVDITEANIKYALTLKLFKSRLNIEGGEGNKTAVDKRDGRIRIERWGNVDWRRESRHRRFIVFDKTDWTVVRASRLNFPYFRRFGEGFEDSGQQSSNYF